jgi:hypothetical protein
MQLIICQRYYHYWHLPGVAVYPDFLLQPAGIHLHPGDIPDTKMVTCQYTDDH